MKSLALERYADESERLIAWRTSGEGKDVLRQILGRLREAEAALEFGGPEEQVHRALHGATALARLHGLGGLYRGLLEAEDKVANERHPAGRDALAQAVRAVTALTSLASPDVRTDEEAMHVDPRAAWRNYVARVSAETEGQARAVGKEVTVELVASAAPVGRDFALIDAILAHLIRNAVDHGIEPTTARRSLGKASTGRVVLTLDCVNGYWFGRLVDDGGGVDLARIRAAGQRLGVLRDGDNATSLEAVMRVLATPGVTTRTSDSKGLQGIGLDAVRTEVRTYDGHLTLERTDSRGTSFTFSWRKVDGATFWLEEDEGEGATRSSEAPGNVAA